MTVRPSRPWLAVLVAGALTGLTLWSGGAVAQADDAAPAVDPSVSDTASPTPSDSTPAADPSPSSSAPAPSDSPAPSTAPTPDPTIPSTIELPSAPAPDPADPSTSVIPAVGSVPSLPPNDGVGPDPGQFDEYFALTAQRAPAAQKLEAATAAYNAAQAAVATTTTLVVRLRVATAQAQVAAADAQATTDDVIRELYQSGDSGLGEIARIIAAGPDTFLDSVDNAYQAQEVSNGVVYAQQRSDQALVAAQNLQRAMEVVLLQKQDDVRTSAAAMAAATAQLAAIDKRLGALALSPLHVPVGADGCPLENVATTLRDGAESIGATALCRAAVKQAATPQAKLAIIWAFNRLGAAYACGGAGRMLPFRADCSSFVSRAYHEGAGLGTASAGSAPSTRDMVPWGGASLDPHYALVAPADLKPGDLVLYNTCPQGGCPYRHVVMYLGSPDGGKTVWMVHTNACGDVAHVSRFWGFPTGGSHPFLVARRVVALPGEHLAVAAPSAPAP